MKAEYNARTGRDCCYVALGELKEENKNKNRRSWVHPVTCDKQKKKSLFWINF
jgi:hypothetical protein